MQATPAEGPEREEELPLQEQQQPRAPEASMGSADNAEPMQATPAEGPEGEEETPLPEQELPLAPVSGEGEDSTPEGSMGSADKAEPMQTTPAEERRGGLSPPTKNKSCLSLPSLAATGVSALVLPRRGRRQHPLRQMRALRSPRLHWSPERGREGKNQRGQKVVPSR
ncbi:UNVERIFIED_CONTAM: hypothetical protein FKN15_032844 [Acipenser sinensis]